MKLRMLLRLSARDDVAGGELIASGPQPPTQHTLTSMLRGMPTQNRVPAAAKDQLTICGLL